MDESHVRCCPGADRTCEKVKACRESSGDFHLYFIPCLANKYIIVIVHVILVVMIQNHFFLRRQGLSSSSILNQYTFSRFEMPSAFLFHLPSLFILTYPCTEVNPKS